MRLGFRTPVTPERITIYQSFNPGSLVSIRGAARSIGAAGKDSQWLTLWKGERTNTDPNRPACDAFAPLLFPEASTLLVSLIELELDTTGWSDDFWSEIDAVQIVGVPAETTGAGANAPPPKPRPHLYRQSGELLRHFYERARFVEMRFGPTPPEDEGEARVSRCPFSPSVKPHLLLHFPPHRRVLFSAGAATGGTLNGMGQPEASRMRLPGGCGEHLGNRSGEGAPTARHGIFGTGRARCSCRDERKGLGDRASQRPPQGRASLGDVPILPLRVRLLSSLFEVCTVIYHIDIYMNMCMYIRTTVRSRQCIEILIIISAK